MTFKKDGDSGYKSEERVTNELAGWVAVILSKPAKKEVQQAHSG
ncbi:hypothetical protein J2TS4_18330 [Paenibacillus sp. J2TS4]|nr:hypothetical protein J2TS4_18330 [Paenibacillus sp. J2TS4]